MPAAAPVSSAAAPAGLTGEVIAAGQRAGLDAVGVSRAERFEGTRRILHERRRAGLSAGMGFTYRNPDRSCDPARILRGAEAIVTGALSYRCGEEGKPDASAGRVARYARSEHYVTLRAKLGVLAGYLRDCGWQARVVADDNALVDREAAFRAGIGWYGKSAMLLIPRRGSWFLLGSVVTDAPLSAPEERVSDGCGTCERCMSACPTGAIVSPGVVDARRCLAWLLQAPGDFPVEFRSALGDRIYGCDVCQEVCPPNRALERHGPPPRPDGSQRNWADLVDMVIASDDDLLARFGLWYIPERDVRYLRRNALVALGNSGNGSDPRVESALRTVLAGGDAMLRRHAEWAATNLGRADLVR